MKKSFVCLALTEPTIRNNIERISQYRKYIDIIELRADFLDPEELQHIDTFPGRAGIPVILTVRKKKDGGKFEDDADRERFSLLRRGLKGKYAYVDIEEDIDDISIKEDIESSGARVIRSFHDFTGVPDNLAARIRKLPRTPSELPKAAVMPKSSADVNKLMEAFSGLKDIEKILLGMGGFGFFTRVLASPLGSFLTYCSAASTSIAAPGHIDPEALGTLYRFKSISEATEIFGIIGNPVMHTSSPKIHNRGFSHIGLDAVYLPFQVDAVDEFMALAQTLNIRGFSVTVPHKEKVIRFLADSDAGVAASGSCNTMIRKPSGWSGYNTDMPGFIAPLKALAGNRPLSSLRTTIVGAGGTAKAVGRALVSEGVKVLIINRTPEKAEALAGALGCAWAGTSPDGIKLMSGYADLIVQTTSAGMEPDIDIDPLPDYRFSGNEIVYEIIYKPERTLFVRRAENAGCRIIFGREMLLNQAYLQFRFFTGKEYPDREGIARVL